MLLGCNFHLINKHYVTREMAYLAKEYHSEEGEFQRRRDACRKDCCPKSYNIYLCSGSGSYQRLFKGLATSSFYKFINPKEYFHLMISCDAEVTCHQVLKRYKAASALSAYAALHPT